MNEAQIENLRDGLANLADEKLLRSAWVEGTSFWPPSYDELMCSIFDDTSVADAMEKGTLEHAVGPSAATLLRKLDELSKQLQGRYAPDSLLEHPTFKEMQRTAREAHAALVEVR